MPEKFVLYAHSGSTTETYAKENGITFRVLEGDYSSLTAGEITSLTNTSKGVKIKGEIYFRLELQKERDDP